MRQQTTVGDRRRTVGENGVSCMKKKREVQRSNETERERETGRQRDRETERQTDRETETIKLKHG